VGVGKRSRLVFGEQTARISVWKTVILAEDFRELFQYTRGSIVIAKYIGLEILTGLCGLSSSEYEKVISRMPSSYLHVCMCVCVCEWMDVFLCTVWFSA
jgi:hypothetical protein